MTWRVGARTDVGLQREGNEDSFFAGSRLLVVADGVGGSVAGEIASGIAVAALSPLETNTSIAEPLGALRDATRKANVDLRAAIEADRSLAGMGTTLTAMLWANGALGMAQLGDSRAYRLRDAELTQITRDHTLVQSLVDDGQITAEEAQVHPRRSWILRALDGREESDPDLEVLEPLAGDRYLLCSDGLSDYVEESAIAAALAGDDPQLASERLVDLALRAGAPDNVTCVVADPVEGERVNQPPLVGGAAATARTPSTAPAAEDRPAAAPAAAPRSHSIRRRLGVVIGLVVVLVAAAVVATVVYINHQWYVGTSHGKVAIYQGVKGSAAGHKLSHVHQLTDLPATAVPGYERDNVLQGKITYGSKSAAQAFVSRLTTQACQQAANAVKTTRPTPSASPHASTTPSTVKHRPKKHRASPTPTPTLPAYCPAAS